MSTDDKGTLEAVEQRIAAARSLLPRMVALRRHLHTQPEVGLELPDTHAYIAQELRALGLEPEVHIGAGVSVRFPGREAGRAAVLRVDMDALPVQERSGVGFASERPGAMHACGHDLHMSTGLGVAAALVEEPPARETVLVFQPGEETDRGAVPTLAAHSSLAALGPAHTFAVHVHATAPVGAILAREGTFMAFGDWFTVEFEGPGGHASQPHLAGNPIEAGARFEATVREGVAALRADEHLVATATEFLMGNTLNVIPASGRVRGTIRTLSAPKRDQLIALLERAGRESAEAARVTGRFTLHEGYPAVVSDADVVAALRACVGSSSLAPQLTDMPEPSMVIEDFAYFTRRWPGTMVYVGAHVPGCTSFNHADDVVYDEEAMATSLALYLMAADGRFAPGD